MRILNIYNNQPPVLKATLWFTVCNIITAGLNFISAPIFTRLLSESEYGILAILMTYEQLFLIFSTWSIQIGGYQKGVFVYKDNINIFTKNTVLLINVLTISFFAICYVFKGSVINITGATNFSLFALFLFMFITPSYQCWLVRKRTNYDYKKAVPVTLLYAIFNIIIPIAALKFIGATANIKFSAFLLSASFFCIYFYISSISTKEKIVKEELTSQWKYLLAYQGPLVIHSLSYLVLNMADRVMIGKMVGNEQAAFYTIAYSLAFTISIVQNSINQAMGPWRYHKLEEKNYSTIGSSTNGLLIFFGGIILTFILVAPEILKLFFTESYYEAVWCIPPVTCGIFFIFLYDIFVTVETYYEKTSYVMYVSLICGIVNIVLNYFGIKYFGYIASAYTTLLSYLLYATLHYVMMKKVSKECIGGIEIFDKKKIIIISISILVLSIGMIFIYPYPVIRYILLAIVLGIAYYYKEVIISLLNQFKSKL